MNIIETLNQNFINCFLKDWQGLSRDERDMLYQRAGVLNQKFNFTKNRLKKLQSLSDILKKEEIRIKPIAEKIYEFQDQLVAANLIDDYEVDVIIECWTGSKYFTKLNKEFEGNPFFKDETLLLFSKFTDDVFYTDNWNETRFKNQFYCHTFHHLHSHTILAWQDIMKIDTVWIELHVRNQFSTDADWKEKSRTFNVTQ